MCYDYHISFTFFRKYIYHWNHSTVMHEVSLVKNIFSCLEDEFPGQAKRVRTIHLTVGLLSNVQPVLMQNAFDAVLKDEPCFSQASLHVEVLSILIHCDECGAICEVQHYKFVCICGKPARNIVQGEEIQISKVEFAEEE